MNSAKTIVIKKYSNRRLYDTDASKYVTLEDICKIVKGGVEIKVIDAKSEEDLTRTIFTQIIFDLQLKGYDLLPTSFLRQVIALNDDNISAVLFSYLENVMDNFVKHQDSMRSQIKSADSFSLFKQLEDAGKRNMEMFEQTMSTFTQFNPITPAKSDADGDKDSKK